MNIKLSIFLRFCALVRAEPERVVVCKGSNTARVQVLLNEGWTVKHQSATVVVEKGVGSDLRYGEVSPIIIFTLTPPPPEVMKANEERRAAEFAKIRADYLAKKSAATKVEK